MPESLLPLFMSNPDGSLPETTAAQAAEKSFSGISAVSQTRKNSFTSKLPLAGAQRKQILHDETLSAS